MMEYEIFKGVVGEKFKEFLPEKYQDAQVEIRPVDKVNRTLDGLSIRVNEPGMNISPTIYVNHMYEDYVTTENLNATLERAAEGFIKAMERTKVCDRRSYSGRHHHCLEQREISECIFNK